MMNELRLRSSMPLISARISHGIWHGIIGFFDQSRDDLADLFGDFHATNFGRVIFRDSQIIRNACVDFPTGHPIAFPERVKDRMDFLASFLDRIGWNDAQGFRALGRLVMASDKV